MDRAKADRAHAPKWMGPNFSKKDGTNTVMFQGSENIFVPMLHHEYSDTATIGNPLRSSVEQGMPSSSGSATTWPPSWKR